ncbi:MAG: hypothetical protein K8R23_16235 [Chthoniobacter sp.]|nr:hypothetical protein [Chthoniobacter sp.]
MSNDFKILTEFLERLGPEVSGRELTVPLGETALKLQRFAAGECDPAERGEVCELLRLHPAWLRWVANRVKMARGGDAGHGVATRLQTDSE